MLLYTCIVPKKVFLLLPNVRYYLKELFLLLPNVREYLKELFLLLPNVREYLKELFLLVPAPREQSVGFMGSNASYAQMENKALDIQCLVPTLKNRWRSSVFYILLNK